MHETWGIISHIYDIEAVVDTLAGACPTRPSTQSSLSMLRSYGIRSAVQVELLYLFRFGYVCKNK